jgi:CheY-like chemotaxis protein
MNRLVLVVEDYESARELYAKCLGWAGFRVALASNGEEAVDQATRLLPEVIVMDLFLPRLDGLEATRRLKSDDRTRNIPVIACSAGASKEKYPDLFHAYLEKPCLPSALIAVVRAALGHRSPDVRAQDAFTQG